jgi:outer membrane protein, heavy metal efflux system
MRNRNSLSSLVAVALFAAGCAGTTPPPRLSPVDPSTPVVGEAPRAASEAARRILDDGLVPDAAARVAVLNNPGLLAEFEEVGVTQAALAEASRIENPEFTALVRFAESGGTNTEFSLIQNVFDLFARPARKGIAEVEVQRAKARLSHRILSLSTEARTALLSLQAEEELLRRLRLIEDLTATAAGFAQKQRDAGTLSEIDFENHLALQREAAVDVTRSEAAFRLHRERVNRLLGLWGGDTNWTLAGALQPLPPTELDFTGMEETAMRQRQDVAVARYGVDLVGRALATRRKTRFFPAGLHAGVSTERDADGGPRVTGPQIALQLPLFDTGKASVRRLEAEHRRAQRLLEAAAIAARSDVRQARDRVVASRRLTESYRGTILPQRQKILALTLQRYNAMFAGAYELLLARRNEVDAERLYVEAWRDYWIARAQLEAALGGAVPGEPTAEGETR